MEYSTEYRRDFPHSGKETSVLRKVTNVGTCSHNRTRNLKKLKQIWLFWKPLLVFLWGLSSPLTTHKIPCSVDIKAFLYVFDSATQASQAMRRMILSRHLILVLFFQLLSDGTVVSGVEEQDATILVGNNNNEGHHLRQERNVPSKKWSPHR